MVEKTARSQLIHVGKEWFENLTCIGLSSKFHDFCWHQLRIQMQMEFICIPFTGNLKTVSALQFKVPLLPWL